MSRCRDLESKGDMMVGLLPEQRKKVEELPKTDHKELG